MAAASKRHDRKLLPLLVALWLGASAAGMFVVFSYSGRAGAAATAPSSWPSAVPLPRDPDRPTLVMLVHPKCACSRASLSELSQIVTRTQGKARFHVLFMRPNGFDEAWARTDTFQRASSIPGVEVSFDPGGRIGAALGATTSGHVVVYDREGRLVFSGGITPSRGHEGDNEGRTRVIASLGGPGSSEAKSTSQSMSWARADTATFGCGLADPVPEITEPK